MVGKLKKAAAAMLSLWLLLGGTGYAALEKEPGLRPLHIVVTDAGNSPVPGLEVEILSADETPWWKEYPASLHSETDEAGSYDAGRLEAGRTYAVTLRNPYAQPRLTQTALLKLTESSRPCELKLVWKKELPGQSLQKAENKLVLRFVDEKGAPLSDAMVQAQKDFYRPGYKEVPYYDISRYTGPDGRIIQLSLEAGNYQVSVSSAKEGGSASFSARFLIPYAGGSREYTLPVPTDGRKAQTHQNAAGQGLRDIAIRVIDEAGSPVPDVVVSAAPGDPGGRATLQPEPLRARKTGRDGIYRSLAHRNVTYKLAVQNNLLSPAYAQQHELSISAADGEEELLYTVVYTGEPPLTTLKNMKEKTVFYFIRPSGEAAGGLAVQVRESATGALISDGWTDYEGKYLLLNRPPARYTLLAADEAAGKSESYLVDTTPGGDLRFELQWLLS